MSDLALFEALQPKQLETSRVELTLAQRAAAGVTVLGLASFVASFVVDLIKPGTIASFGLLAPLLVAGLTCGGALAWSFVTYGGTHPGIRHDRVYFGTMTRRAGPALALGFGMTTFYLFLYWWGDRNPAEWMRIAVVALGGLSLGYVGYRFRREDAQNRKAILGFAVGLITTVLFTALYWWDGQKIAGLDPLAGGIALVDPLSMAIAHKPADKWFLYGTLYTVAVLVMGVRMLFKYRHNRYQLLRTGSVMWFQLGFAFLIPNILKSLNQPDFYFTYFWPLKPEYVLPFSVGWTWEAGSLGRAMILWGLFASFIAVPVLTYFYGKRWYCSWVCGCGALAETLGDPWRQLSDKSERAWRFERWSIHLVLLAIVLITIGMWGHTVLGLSWFADPNVDYHNSMQAWYNKWYGFFIASAFSGVVGTGFYPVFGSRTWCRFGCPQAAILGLIQRFFSRFRITTNGGQCISCGNCSTFCEMGIDVRAYAQRGENIVRASCVGCGVCAAVCPRGVLKLENGPVGDRFPGADDPLHEILRSLGIESRS